MIRKQKITEKEIICLILFIVVKEIDEKLVSPNFYKLELKKENIMRPL